MQRRERGLNALALLVGDQAGKHLPEVRMPCARVDVLPAIRLEERGLDRLGLGFVDRAAARRHEVSGVGLACACRMPSTAATSSMNSSTARSRCSAVMLGVVAHPFELVEDRVLAFFLPVIEEHVLEELRELGVGRDALAVMKLREQLDVQRQRQHRPGALAEHRVGDGVGVDVEAIAGGSTSPIIASMRRNSAWCFNSSSLNRTSASSATWSPNQ